MSFEDFTKSVFCSSGARCPHCRNKIKGLTWRTGMAKMFNLPSADFECPKKKPWVTDSQAAAQSNLPPQPPKQDIKPPAIQAPKPPPKPQMAAQQAPRPAPKVITNNQWNDTVARIEIRGTDADKALAKQIIEQSKSCGCKARFAGMQYQLWEKYGQ